MYQTWLRVVSCLCLLCVSSCTPWVLGEKPDPAPPVPPVTSLSSFPLPPPAPPQPPPAPDPILDLPVLEPQPIAYIPAPPPAPVAQTLQHGGKGSKGGKALPEATPAQVIQEAQREARLAPTKRGYFGARGEYRYLWTPGKIYDIYLAPGVGTKLLLPPGETLAHALILNPKSFDVQMATVGEEGTARTLMLIRPCAPSEAECTPSPEVDVGVTSHAGRSYDLHLIIGKVSMVAVTWEIVPIPRLELDEQSPGLAKGRP